MDTKTFFFNASGCAVGGEIRSPLRKTLDSAAATSLPISGGDGKASDGPFELPNVLSYKNAATAVSGKRNDLEASHNTVVSSSVDGLTLAGVVTADRVVGKLSSNCKADDAENCINATGSEFVNLQIGGFPATVELDLTLFCDLDTMDKFKKKFQTDAAFKKMAQKRFLWDDVDANAPDWLKHRYSWVKPAGALPESKGIVPCSIVKSITCANPNIQIFGNVIIIPNFGTISLGEIQLKANERRLTMMRVSMSPATTRTSATTKASSTIAMSSPEPPPPPPPGGDGLDGDVVICGIGGNGSNYP